MTLHQIATRICDEIGGTAVQHSDGTIHVLHCPLWTFRASAILRCDFSSAMISVRPSVSSLSGFIVVIGQRAPPRSTAYRLLVAILSATMLFALIWGLFDMQFDPLHTWRQLWPDPAASCSAAPQPSASSKKHIILDKLRAPP